ncbi:hypothetical protein DMN79_18715 [Vibrio parahaemolyticus]|nr:hypothetical protein [Vibrio parahaemolyticus]
MIKSTSHRRIRLAIGIRVIESFGETRSFFFASILNPNIQEFKAQKKAPTHRASAYHSERLKTPTSTIIKNESNQIQTFTVAFKIK